MINYRVFKTNKCLKALAAVDEWDRSGCPFCGQRQQDKYGYPESRHDDDCPVKLAKELLEEEV